MQLTAEKVWAKAQSALRELLSGQIYELWFANVRAVDLTPEAISLVVPDDFCEVWLTDNYLGLLKETVAKACQRPLDIRFVIASPATAPAGGLETAPAPVAKVEAEPAYSGGQADLAFNPRNTFETFVVGSNNSFSHAAALAVAQAPGRAYNPLFVYGGVGLGKTHLLHAIGQHVVRTRKAARVAYLSSEKFTNEYIDAIQSNTVARFRRKYRQSDVLLIDDIQFLAGKERIQEEFFHTFNALHESHRQIVLTCDRPAGEIHGLEQRLVSRFEWGMTTDLQPPDAETRMAILRQKEKALGVKLPDAVIEFLANRIRSNIRRLEGALIRVATYGSLTGKPVTVEVVESVLHEVLHEEGRHALSIDAIQKRVAEHFDLRLADMTSKRRPENIAFPRQIAMYLARTLTESSLNTIGEAFGGRDHGTVLHACRLVKDRMEVDANVRQVVTYLEKQLRR
jgi:chromosomal replication initiator protein